MNIQVYLTRVSQSSSRFAVGSLVVSNTIPLLGVLFLDWSLFMILALYWAENGVVGLYNIAKMICAKGDLSDLVKMGNLSQEELGQVDLKQAGGGRWFLIPFFLVHYGLFWVVHGVFVFVLFGGIADFGPFGGGRLGAGAAEALSLGSVATLIALGISHGISFVTVFLGKGEYRRTHYAGQMFAPYKRVVVLHLTILFGAFATMLLRTPIVALILLIVLKTGVDLRAHDKEHRGMAVAGD
jgi:hypothetical protein